MAITNEPKLYDKYGNVIDHLTQWDINLTLQIPDFKYELAPICHFAARHDKESKTVTSTLSDGTVYIDIPNILLTTSGAFDMFVFLYDMEVDTGRTLYSFHIPVSPKAKPETYEYSDNIEIIEVTVLKARLEALIAQAEQMVTQRIGDLDEAYTNQIAAIHAEIKDDKDQLNAVIVANTAEMVGKINDDRASLTGDISNMRTSLTGDITDMRTQLTGDITDMRTQLNSDIQSNLSTILNNIQDGTPRGVFSDPTDLENASPGVYLLVDEQSENNGWIYYWDGSELSERIVYYAGMVINHDTITYSMLTDDLKKQSVEKIVPYTLLAESWDNGEQEIDISDVYTVTEHTKIDVDLSDAAYIQMLADGCVALYVVTLTENGVTTLTAHHIGLVPTADITIQLTIRETV